MGNSVGFYAVSHELKPSRVSSPTLSDLDILTDPGGGCDNVQRLSVSCLDSEFDISSPSYLETAKSIDIDPTVSRQSIGSIDSELSVKSCPEARRKVRCANIKSFCPRSSLGLAETFRLHIHDTWKDGDSDTSSQPYGETSQEINDTTKNKDVDNDNEKPLYLETCIDEPKNNELPGQPSDLTSDSCTRNNKQTDHYIPAQSTRVIQSLLLELQEEGDFPILTPHNRTINPLDDDDVDSDRPVVYTATNAGDWRLGTILEESGKHHKIDSDYGSELIKPKIIIDKYNSSDDEEGMTIGSAVNVTDIDAERQKEEGIQLCLEPYEDKIEKIEECLLNSSDSHTSTNDGKEPIRRQPSVDVATVIGGNHNITYLRFGAGLEDDVSNVVASEYSQCGICSHKTLIAEDTLVSEIHMIINDYTTSTSEQVLHSERREDVGSSNCSSPRQQNERQREYSHVNHLLDNTLVEECEGDDDDENGSERCEDGGIEVTEVKESWRQLVVRRSSAGALSGFVTANSDHSESSSNQLAEELSQLRLENEKLSARNRSLQSEVEELRRVKETIVEEDLQLKPRINEMTIELTHAKEALSALKADRKRLKAEKFDLLNQMKQLYATLEDKEKELRDFIRNYEQRMKESDESLRHLAAERDETEREKWNILKHARDESERVVKLSAQLGLKEATVKKLQEELEMVRKQLSSVGYYSDAESVRTNGLTTPTASTPACSPLPLSTPTPTPNGRGSSADSGVRLSSDRDSTASHDGTPTITVKRGSLDCDTLSVCSSATAVSQYFYYACGAGTPKESPSLSPLYATPVCLKREDQGGDNTPTSTPTSTAASVNSPAVGGLANSSASAGGLSRSAEQLCERLSEAAETSKVRGTNTLSRKSHKSGGTWGSISRVFARQKKRAALDASLYDGNASDKRASWSPSSSLCASPLTEESYSEKLRLLEEAQHIPLERWKAPTVLAWLEVTLGMPQYGAMCAENVRSGKVLLELSDSELEAGLGIAHPMHRKKLRLAIEELREPRLSRFPRISILGHTWVSSEWLPDLGLPQYCDAFANNLVDGRLLEALTKKELEKHLGVHRKFHQASIIHGVHLLRIVRFDRQVLAERRRQCEHIDADPVVWTNMRWVRWARSIDLAEYADNLKDSGVHGALVVLESSFTSDTMATALGIPQSKNIIRRHLATELEGLVNPARQQLDEQARYAKMERRRQEKLASGGSLGRSFSRSYGTGLEKGEKDKRRASLRPLQKKGSLSRALGLRLREEAATGGNNGGESSSSGGQSPAVIARTNAHRAPRGRPRSTIMPSGVYVHHETHRRVKSIGDIETITVTPV